MKRVVEFIVSEACLDRFDLDFIALGAGHSIDAPVSTPPAGGHDGQHCKSAIRQTNMSALLP
jgi:hypothetical protein